MVAKGSYTPRSGALAGTTFPSYYRYQTARAQQMGFPSYGAQRRLTGIGNPLVTMMINRSVFVGGQPRTQAAADVRDWYQRQPYKEASVPAGSKTYSDAQGRRKHDAIAYLMDRDLYPTGDDAANEIPY
jgi:hypothetical protein